MKIAFIVPSLANKGPVIVVKNLVDFLVSQNIYCEVFYFSDIRDLDFNCKTTKIKLFNLKVIQNFDILHSHGIRPDLYSFFNFYAKIKITTLHNYIREELEKSLKYSRLKSKLFETIWNIFLLRMDKIVVLSKHAQDYYQQILFNQNIQYIYNGLNISIKKTSIANTEVDQLHQIKQNGYEIIGSNAFLTYRKGLHQIIEVLPHFQNLFFIIIGDGPEKENLILLAHKLGVSKRCLFLGYKLNATDYLKFYDYFAIPSYSEGFPLALIEASAYKKVIIASDIAIHKEVYADDEISFFTLNDKESLINAIKYAMLNKKLFSEKAFAKYTNHYTLEHMGMDYLKLYKNTLKEV